MVGKIKKHPLHRALNQSTKESITKVIEKWKEIPDYEEMYAVSNCGKVKSLRFGRTLKPSLHSGTGYSRVSLCKQGMCKVHYIHQLVAKLFLTRKANNLEVNHIDGNKTNNKVTNLEWVTHHENVLHSHKLGINKKNQVRGSRTGSAKLNEKQVLEIKRLKGTKTHEELAKKYNVSTGSIWHIFANRTWTHVKEHQHETKIK